MVPVCPTAPANRAWSSGNPLLPCQVVTTGARERLGQRPELDGRVGGDDPTADGDDRSLGVVENPCRVFDRIRVWVKASDWQAARERVQLDVGRRGLDVHRHLDVHRSRTAGEHRAERPVHHERQLLDGARLEMTFGQGADGALEAVDLMAVELLHDPVTAHVRGRAAAERRSG